MHLAVAVAWILGARRTALGIFVGMIALAVSVSGPAGLARMDLLVLLILPLATWQRWPVPQLRARIVLLAAIPVALGLWVLTEVWGREGIMYPSLTPRVAWGLAAAGAAAASLVTLRQPWPTRLAAAVGCGLTPSALLILVYGRYDWVLSITVVVALLGAVATWYRGTTRPVEITPRYDGTPPART